MGRHHVDHRHPSLIAAAGVKGRGDYVRLCFEEAGVPYEDAGVKHGSPYGGGAPEIPRTCTHWWLSITVITLGCRPRVVPCIQPVSSGQPMPTAPPGHTLHCPCNNARPQLTSSPLASPSTYLMSAPRFRGGGTVLLRGGQQGLPCEGATSAAAWRLCGVWHQCERQGPHTTPPPCDCIQGTLCQTHSTVWV
jgi:hypothetical protein